MSEKKPNQIENETAPEAYEPPAVISEDTFETLSMACGKQSLTQFSCRPPNGSLLIS